MQLRESLKIALCFAAGFGLACSTPDPGDETAVEFVEETGLPQSGPAFERDFVPKNLLFVAFDTTRLDRIGPELTPNLSTILAQSVVFSKHQVCSNWTYFSFGCVLVGKSNIDQGWVPIEFGDLGPQHKEPPYPEGPEMMAERFAAGGFETSLVGSHPFLDPDTNLFQGYQSQRLIHPGGAGEVVDSALKEAEILVAKGSPWMMHVHFNDPHLPYKARLGFVEGFDELPQTQLDFTSRDLLSQLISLWPKLPSDERQDVLVNLNTYYNGEVAFMDFHFGQMWDQLRDSGALQDTLVVFFSDHGEQFFEHGLFGHRTSLYSEETSALLGFWHEDLPAKSSDWASANEDILPTLLSLFDLPGVEGGGRALNELDELAAAPVFAVHGGHEKGVMQSVRLGSDLLIYNWLGIAKRFELASDKAEQIDRMGENPVLEAELMKILRPQVDALNALLPEREPLPLR